MKLLDNKGHGSVNEAISGASEPNGALSILTSELSIFAWNALKKEMARQSKARLLLSSNSDTDNLSNTKEDPTAFATSLLGPLEERRARNSLLAPATARDFAEWLRKKADVRLARRPPLSASTVFPMTRLKRHRQSRVAGRLIGCYFATETSSQQVG